MSARKKEVKYLNKSFSEFKASLIEFAKTYFPQTYTDFNDADPGSMFMDMSAVVGDVLSLYDSKLYRENLLLQAQERKNLLNIAQAYGYKPKLSVPSTVEIDCYQLLPASGSGQNIAPDYSYAMIFKANSTVQSTEQDVSFTLVDDVNFNINTPSDPTIITVYNYNQTTGAPEFFLLKKKGKCISGQINTVNISVNEAKQFLKVRLNGENFIKIIDVTDADGNEWLEVPYLAQDTVFEQTLNTELVDPLLAQYKSSTPYLLRTKQVPRRFVTRITQTEQVELQFGSGVSADSDGSIIPNPTRVGSPLVDGVSKFETSYDPSNVFLTKTYGQAPSNTTLTIRYLSGGGVSTNVAANTIIKLSNVTLDTPRFPQNTQELNNLIRTSLAINNPERASGGAGPETAEEIRHNAMSALHAQNRAVSISDYIIRAYSMDPRFGSVYKAHIVQDEQLNLYDLQRRVINPFTLNLYTLGQNSDGQLAPLNLAVKQNLKTYLEQYRMATDSINIKDAYIINIGIVFEIIPVPGVNNNEVLLQCIAMLKDYFNIARWQINQPIIVGEIYDKLNDVAGVQHVSRVMINNLYDSSLGYSNVLYNINSATKLGVIYPSLDPSIFEVKFPNRDIIGRIATY